MSAFDMMDITAAQLGTMNREDAEREIRSRVQSIALGEGVILSRVLGLHKMLLRASDRGFSRHVMLDGYWESWLTIFCARTLQPGMVVFDVGANLGYYTLLFADRVGPTGKVVAIEPNPMTFELLAETISLNGFDHNVTLVQAAATDAAQDTLELFVPLGEPKNATVAFEGGARAAELRVKVPCVSIDQLSAGLTQVDFLKIDVEGAEASVLRGMTETIARFRPTIVLEFNAARYDNPAEILQQMLSIYGSVSEIDFNGDCNPVAPSEILSTRLDEDRLLCFTRISADS
jgi:FkbM family methyltransferase